jgi:hypothetical protein
MIVYLSVSGYRVQEYYYKRCLGEVSAEIIKGQRRFSLLLHTPKLHSLEFTHYNLHVESNLNLYLDCTLI